MNENYINSLLDRYKAGTASEEDKALLESWYLDKQEPEPAELSMTERLAAVEHVWANLNTDVKVRKVSLWPRIAVAASVLIVLSFSAYFIFRSGNTKGIDTDHLANTQYDIAPGGNKATLTLANGRVISLSNQKNGIVINAAAINYNDGTEIDTALQGKKAEAGKNKQITLATPQGGTFQVVLPDGSKVWLNAASSISFPASFTGLSLRKVELLGEAYFEVAKNKAVPFQVLSPGQVVEVLGTHFDINTYADEPSVKTTLMEGSVRIGTTVLKPGEQANREGKNIAVTTANVDAVIGWKNNYVVFEDEKIESVMRKIARWYNVEVVYEGGKPTDDFGGRVSRSAYVSQVLKKLELTNKVHFKITGRRIIVSK